MSFYKPHERRYTLHEVRLHGKQEKVLWKLFWSTLYLSAFTFGGGYVIVTLMKRKFVDQFHWIEENEMLDLVAIAQSAPGAVGYKLAGIPGAIAATIGSVLPSCILVTLIARLYLKYRSLNASSGCRRHDHLRGCLHFNDCLLGRRRRRHAGGRFEPCRRADIRRRVTHPRTQQLSENRNASV